MTPHVITPQSTSQSTETLSSARTKTLTVYTQDDHNKMPLMVGHLALFAARSKHELGLTGMDVNVILASDGG